MIGLPRQAIEGIVNTGFGSFCKQRRYKSKQVEKLPLLSRSDEQLDAHLAHNQKYTGSNPVSASPFVPKGS